MFVKKFMGFEIEAGGGSTLVTVPIIGSLWTERNAVVRGRWWADFMVEGGNLHLYFGERHTVLCPSVLVALYRLVEGNRLQTA